MKLLIKNGRILDPATKTDRVGSLYIEGGTILSWDPKEEEIPADAQIVDAGGYIVMPGLIDMHVHFRDPGQTWKEDLFSGAAAAAHGGYTTVVAMANTAPPIDTAEKVLENQERAKETGIHIIQAGTVTLGMEGLHLADFEKYHQAGVRVVSEDGQSVMNAGLFRLALLKARRFGMTVLDHCEEKYLVNGGCVNEDEVSRKEGLPGITNSVEDAITARDLMIAEDTGAHLHLCHMSTVRSVEMLKQAKKAGAVVSGEVTPHHLILTSKDRRGGDTNFKMNPPLRTEKDRKALVQGLLDGTIDVISTDHAPHRSIDKETSMVKAPFGIVGIETAAVLIWTEFVRKGLMTPLQMVEKMSYNPARLLGLERRGSIAPGSEADLVIWDPEANGRINAAAFASKSRNTPFQGRRIYGEVLMTVCAGKIVYASQRKG